MKYLKYVCIKKNYKHPISYNDFNDLTKLLDLKRKKKRLSNY